MLEVAFFNDHVKERESLKGKLPSARYRFIVSCLLSSSIEVPMDRGNGDRSNIREARGGRLFSLAEEEEKRKTPSLNNSLDERFFETLPR